MSIFKKVTATAAALSVVLSAVGPTTLARASVDTSIDAANRLAAAGVIKDSSKNPSEYNLGMTISRREMLKVMMNLSSVQITNTCEGKFTDMTSADWGCKYAEAALKAGFIAANKTFRPNDMVSKAEALKMIMQATGVSKKAGVEPWQKAYVDAALEEGIISNSFTDYNASATREFVIVAADSTLPEEDSSDDLGLGDMFGDVDGTGSTLTGTTATGTNSTGSTATGSTATGSTSTGVIKVGTLNMSLSSTTPAATSVPQTASAVPYMNFDVTAGTSDVSLSTLTLKREGFGTRDDLYRVWIELNGVRVSERASFLSDDTANVTFSPALVVKAGTTQTLKIVAEQKSSNGVINKVSIVSAASVNSTAATVSGTFPITGNSMTAASYTVASLDIAYQGSASDYKVGDKNIEFSRVRVLNSSSDKDVKVQSIKFRNAEDGDIAEDLENIALYEGGVKVSSGTTVSGRDVTFTLGNYIVKAGVSKTFVIQGDVKNARNTSGDKFKFEIRYQEDLNAVEVATGFGAPNDVTTETSVRPTYTVKGSTITVTKSSTSPSTQTVSQGTNDVTLLVADATINQAFRADGLNIRLVTTGLAGADKMSDSFGNIRVYIGDKIYNSFDFASTDVGNNTIAKSFDSSWIFDAGKTTIKVVANVKSAAKVGAGIKALLGDGGAVGLFKTPRYTQNDNTVASTDISVSADGLVASVGTDGVTVVRNDGFSSSSTNIVAGAQGATVYKATMSAGNVSDVKVTKLSYAVYNYNGTNTNLLTNWRVKVNGAQVGSSRSISSGKVDFSDAVFTIAKNQTAQIEVICDVATSYVNEYIVTEFDDTTSTLLNVTSGQTIDASKISVTNGSELYVNGQGELTVAKDGNTPVSAVVVAGTQGVELARFKFSTKYDEMYLKNLYVKNVLGNVADSRIASLKLYDLSNPAVAIATASMENGVAHFSIGDTTLKLPKDDSKVLLVRADFNTISSADDTGKLVQLAIDDTKDAGGTIVAGTVDGVNVSSVSTGEPLTVINGAANVTTTATTVNTMQIRKTSVTVASVALSNSTFAASTDKEIYRFKVAADVAGDAYLAKVALKVTLTNATAANFKLYKTSDQSNVLASVAALASGKAVLTLGANEQTIAKGSEVEFVIKADLTSTAAGGAKASISSNLVEDAASFVPAAKRTAATAAGDFVFSDNAASQATRNGLSVDYYTGYKTTSFPTDVKSLTE